jgi:replicative superfamily II helicase
MVFDVAYNTNENMLVCAPTGAGKTDVAMTTVLKEIKVL